VHIEDSIKQFVRNDTALFREEGKLGRIQTEKLDPVIEYINKLLKINLEPTEQLFAKELTEEELMNIHEYVKNLSNWKLISMEQATINTKSTSLGVALINGEISI
jgi:chaperone required for assembly of F1-ATPase